MITPGFPYRFAVIRTGKVTSSGDSAAVGRVDVPGDVCRVRVAAEIIAELAAVELERARVVDQVAEPQVLLIGELGVRVRSGSGSSAVSRPAESGS
jgi:hypothetical protein